MGHPDTPLFVKTHDFNVWLFQDTQRFPKHLRHTYTNRLESSALEFEEALLMGNAARGPERSRWLERADGRLVCLRALLRYAYDFQLLAGNQVAHAAGLVDELGRLLGAWRKGGTAKRRLQSRDPWRQLEQQRFQLSQCVPESRPLRQDECQHDLAEH